MVESLAFHYQPGTSILHRFDPRFKTVSLLLLSPSIMLAFPLGLFVLSMAFIGSTIYARLNFRSIIYDLRYFFFLLVAVFFSRAVFIPGNPIFEAVGIQVTDLGILSGMLFCWRLILVAIGGLMYAATTRSREIRAAVEWLMAHIPGVPEKRVGVMIGLVVRLIPMVLDQARKTMSVQKARCVECRKNPFYRLTRFALPMLRRTVKQADCLTLAMVARCYHESGTLPAMKIRSMDWWLLGGVFSLCIILIGSKIYS